MKKILLLIILLILSSCGTRKYYRHTTSLVGSSLVKHNSANIEIDEISSYDEDSSILTSSETEGDIDDVLTSNPLIRDDVETNDDNSNIKEVKSKTSIIPNKEVSVGKVLYRIPDTMRLYVNYRITVRISKSMSNRQMSDGIEGKCIVSKIPVTYKMDVTIKDESPDDDKSFKINQINSSQQIVDSIGYTEWVFNIQPIKNGDKKLNLIISIIKNGDKKEIVYTDVIYVKSDIKKTAISFWGKYWQWLMSTLIIPFVIFLYKRKKKEE